MRSRRRRHWLPFCACEPPRTTEPELWKEDAANSFARDPRFAHDPSGGDVPGPCGGVVRRVGGAVLHVSEGRVSDVRHPGLAVRRAARRPRDIVFSVDPGSRGNHSLVIRRREGTARALTEEDREAKAASPAGGRGTHGVSTTGARKPATHGIFSRRPLCGRGSHGLANSRKSAFVTESPWEKAVHGRGLRTELWASDTTALP